MEILNSHYTANGRPGHGKTVQQVLDEVELKMSASLAFSIHEDPTTKQKYISAGDSSAWVPKDSQMKVFRDDHNIPYISNGTDSWFCATFFQTSDGAKKAPSTTGSLSSGASTSLPRTGSRSSLSSTPATPTAPSPALPGMTRQLAAVDFLHSLSAYLREVRMISYNIWIQRNGA